MAFDDVRLDESIERGVVGGLGFKTIIQPVGSGREQRNSEWALTRGQWDYSRGITDADTFRSWMSFFLERRGKRRGFRFKDYADYSTYGVRQLLGTGDGILTDYQLIKIYGTVFPYNRKITRPVTTPTDTVQIWVNNVLQVITTDYTIEPLGIIRFVTPPPMTEAVEAEFEYDVPVRFDLDKMNIRLEWAEAGSMPEMNIVELRE